MDRDIHTHQTHPAQVPVLEDSFGIGQASVARIQLEIATSGLQGASERLLSTEYEPEITLPMWRRIFQHHRTSYDTALAVLEATK